ncbi:MAG: hypothetical protein BWY82_01052 [Verrucomicrobia bacterium ADurb.Bin474]|nr:MAG: hypothetical protein BWY82_01052 [Verrucomicrobia bacterium ADurb.Bin474]
MFLKRNKLVQELHGGVVIGCRDVYHPAGRAIEILRHLSGRDGVGVIVQKQGPSFGAGRSIDIRKGVGPKGFVGGIPAGIHRGLTAVVFGFQPLVPEILQDIHVGCRNEREIVPQPSIRKASFIQNLDDANGRIPGESRVIPKLVGGIEQPFRIGFLEVDQPFVKEAQQVLLRPVHCLDFLTQTVILLKSPGHAEVNI